MKKPRHMGRIIALVLPALLLAGCLQPENRPVFEQAWKKIPKEKAAPVVIPEALQPNAPGTEPLAIVDGSPLELSLEQAIWLALEHNRDLRVSKLNPVIAGTFEEIERGVFDPQVFGELSLSEQELVGPNAFGGLSTFEENGYNLSAGIRQQLPSGTQIEGTVSQSKTDTDGVPTQQEARLGISVTQSLLRGAGPIVNLIDVRKAKLGTDISIFELRGVTEAFLADTENAYWDYVLAGQEIDIYKKSLAVAQQQLDEIKQRIEIGTLAGIEEAAANAELARRRQALIDARASLEASHLRLVRLLNPSEEGRLDVEIKTTSSPSIEPQPIADLEDRLQLAEKLRPDLAEARLRLRQNTLQTIATANGLLPQLDLFITLGRTGYAESFGDSFSNLKDNTRDFSAGIRLSQYLDNRSARASDLASRASRQQAEESVQNLRQLVSLDVRLAVNEAERSRQQIDATKATRVAQEKTLQAEQDRFEVGASTSLLVAQAQRDLLASAIAEVEAVINYRKALVSLYLVEGSLLERRGVNLSTPQS